MKDQTNIIKFGQIVVPVFNMSDRPRLLPAAHNARMGIARVNLLNGPTFKEIVRPQLSPCQKTETH